MSKGVFKGHTSSGSKAFYRLICLDVTIFVLPGVFTFKEAICPRNLAKALYKNEKRQLPVGVRRSKTRFFSSLIMCV